MRGAELHLPAGRRAPTATRVLVTPESAGWELCGLRVIRLAPGASRTIATGADEVAVLPLSGGGRTVEVDGHRFELEGRATVFSRITDWAYVPIELRAHDLERATAARSRSRPPVRRAGSSPRTSPLPRCPSRFEAPDPPTRQVTNFLVPGEFDGADKLICCELLTPDGNWSSYPPHKHDDTEGSPVGNEEIYYFRVGRAGSTDYAPEGYGTHRTYTHDGSIDATVTVRDGDVFLVPRGYHGPCAAAPGYPLYYLNVMAGPAPGRTFAFVDDPPHALDPRHAGTSRSSTRACP